MAPRTPEPPLVVAPFVGKPQTSEEKLAQPWTPPETRTAVWGLSPVVVGLIAATVVTVFCAGLCVFYVLPFHRRIQAERKHAKVVPMHFDAPNSHDKSNDSSIRKPYFSPSSPPMDHERGSTPKHLSLTESALGPRGEAKDQIQRFGSMDEEMINHRTDSDITAPVDEREIINQRTDSDTTAAVAFSPRRPPGEPIRPAGGRFGHARARLHDLQAQLDKILDELPASSASPANSSTNSQRPLPLSITSMRQGALRGSERPRASSEVSPQTITRRTEGSPTRTGGADRAYKQPSEAGAPIMQSSPTRRASGPESSPRNQRDSVVRRAPQLKDDGSSVQAATTSMNALSLQEIEKADE